MREKSLEAKWPLCQRTHDRQKSVPLEKRLHLQPRRRPSSSAVLAESSRNIVLCHLLVWIAEYLFRSIHLDQLAEIKEGR
jgi:hypothetical protein